MKFTLMFLMFGTVALLVAVGVHLYFYRRFVVGPNLPAPWRRVVTGILILLGLGLPLALILPRFLPVNLTRVVLYPFYVWIGAMALFFFIFLGTDLVRLVAALIRRLARRPATTDLARRRHVARLVAGAAAGVVFPAVAFGAWRALGTLAVRRVTVPLSRLPVELDGVTIAQISDLHLGPTRTGAWMSHVVDRVNRLKADIVAITGDLVDGSVEDLGPEVASLGRLRAAHGVYFVTGNHEYYSGAVAWVAELERLGIRVLRNERVTITRGGAGFDLAGVDDYKSSGLALGHAHDVARAVRGRDPRRELVLLAHQPLSIFDAAEHGVGLVLAGHTHGGQFFPITEISPLVNRYVAGLHRHGPTWIYVNSGTGFWGPPLRLMTTAEISLITLRRTS